MIKFAPALAFLLLGPAPSYAQAKKKARSATPAPAGKPAPAAAGLLAAADRDLPVLETAVGDFTDCADGVEFMTKDLKEEFARQPPKGRTLVYQSQDLLVIKQNRLSLQRSRCSAMMTETSPRFNAISLSLGLIEPPDHPGVAARREKLSALLVRFNAAATKIGFKPHDLSAPARQPVFTGKGTGLSKF
ncbi:MAG: hypothetical protein KGL74_14110 [Elusimicrobia bacterium]|nr:hypothetical protein [Elusimicrobiota bacterium]